MRGVEETVGVAYNHPISPGLLMSKKIFISLPVNDLSASIAFYKALGFEQNLPFSDESVAGMIWSEAIHVMLLSHAKWRSFTELPLPPVGTAGHMLNLSLDSREAVDQLNQSAVANGGRADVNPVQDHGFMYSRDLARRLSANHPAYPSNLLVHDLSLIISTQGIREYWRIGTGQSSLQGNSRRFYPTSALKMRSNGACVRAQ